ncbi:MAG: hypothetical protein JXR32_05635 [Anaerolineaceae bacterium]|nr:hypothetical protein [Anaerolineaceae bacterium]
MFNNIGSLSDYHEASLRFRLPFPGLCLSTVTDLPAGEIYNEILLTVL